MEKRNYAEITPEIEALTRTLEKNGVIDRELYDNYRVNRGLRDLNGNGVLTGLTEISEVNGRDPEGQGNRLRKSPVFNHGQSIGKRPGTALTFTGQRILDRSIGFEHLHTKLTEHIDNYSCMSQGDMDIIFMETAIEAPMEFVFNTPMLALKG